MNKRIKKKIDKRYGYRTYNNLNKKLFTLSWLEQMQFMFTYRYCKIASKLLSGEELLKIMDNALTIDSSGIIKHKDEVFFINNNY